jgi:hypothetical protein
VHSTYGDKNTLVFVLVCVNVVELRASDLLAEFLAHYLCSQYEEYTCILLILLKKILHLTIRTNYVILYQMKFCDKV